MQLVVKEIKYCNDATFKAGHIYNCKLLSLKDMAMQRAKVNRHIYKCKLLSLKYIIVMNATFGGITSISH